MGSFSGPQTSGFIWTWIHIKRNQSLSHCSDYKAKTFRFCFNCATQSGVTSSKMSQNVLAGSSGSHSVNKRKEKKSKLQNKMKPDQIKPNAIRINQARQTCLAKSNLGWESKYTNYRNSQQPHKCSCSQFSKTSCGQNACWPSIYHSLCPGRTAQSEIKELVVTCWLCCLHC